MENMLEVLTRTTVEDFTIRYVRSALREVESAYREILEEIIDYIVKLSIKHSRTLYTKYSTRNL